jgi:hypothetical protein
MSADGWLTAEQERDALAAYDAAQLADLLAEERERRDARAYRAAQAALAESRERVNAEKRSDVRERQALLRRLLRRDGRTATDRGIAKLYAEELGVHDKTIRADLREIARRPH